MPNLDAIQSNAPSPSPELDETSVPVRRVTTPELSNPVPPPPSTLASEDEPFEDEIRRPIEEMDEHTIGFVIKQALFVIFQPKASFEDLKEERAIGRPVAVMVLFGILLLALQLVLFYSSLAEISEGNGLLRYLFPPLTAFSPSQIFYLFAVLTVVWASQLIGFWAIAVIVTDFMARLLGGRGSWSTFAVSTLYWMIASWAVVAPLVVVVGWILTSASLWWFLGVLLSLLGLIWMGVVLARGVSVQYELPMFRSLIAVFLPALLLFFGFMVASVLVPPLDADASPPIEPTTQLNTNAATPSPAVLNSNLAVNANTPIENANLNTNSSLPGFYQADTTLVDELTEAKRKELSRVSEVGVDQVRAEQLIEMKYDLKLYVSVYKTYPVSKGIEKLDGRSDSLNLALEDFYGSRRSFVDPQYPSYYYSYESDGKTFRLTGFHATRQEPQTITDQD